MRNIWFISDTHFFHTNILHFKDFNGVPTRPMWYTESEDPVVLREKMLAMNEYMVDRWNERVRDGDYVYHMGDVFMTHASEFYPLWARLKGSKRLLVGNHDDVKQLIGCFKKIGIWRTFKEENFTASHIPMHHGSVKGTFNLHGHVHSVDVKDLRDYDPRYINNCVEKTGYAPRHLDEVLQIIKDRS